MVFECCPVRATVVNGQELILNLQARPLALQEVLMTKHKRQTQPPHEAPGSIKRVLYSVEDAAEALSMGRTSVFALIRDGRLQAVKVGKRRLIPVSELEAFAVRLQQGA
jgi:excisionase family DNA binding protein